MIKDSRLLNRLFLSLVVAVPLTMLSRPASSAAPTNDTFFGFSGPEPFPIDPFIADLRSALDRKLGPLRVVPLDIEQILLNLLNNSLDSLQAKMNKSERHRPQLRIVTDTFRQDGDEWARVTVHDNGLGIAKADLKNVMRPFFTTKRPGEGTGLGLAICQQLAGKYGGALAIDSKEGAWAEVKIRIPYRAEV